MKRARALLVASAFACGSALVVSGCGGDDDVVVAFGGNCAWTLEEADAQEGDPAGSVRLNVTADCDYTGTGFGVLAATGTAFIGAPDGSGNATITSDLVYTDGDGDNLEGTMSGAGTYAGQIFTFTGDENFTNGTGGFAGATAGVDADGVLDLEHLLGTYDTDGSIDIPG